MANIFLNIEKGIQVAAEDVLHFVSKAQAVIAASPVVIAALGTILGAVATAAANTAAAAQAGGLNITFDEQAWASILAVWPDVKAFAKDLGISL